MPDEEERGDERQRQEDIERGAGEIDPEVTDGLRRSPCEGADQRDCQRNAGGGGNEVLRGERRHLGQIAHGALAAVVLPVGVGGEADGGIERQIRRHRGHAGGIERQDILQPLQRVDEDEAGRVEEEHGERIGDPVLLACFLDAGQAIEAGLDRPKERCQERALALEHLSHEAAERNDECSQDHEIDRYLNPAVDSHDGVSQNRSGRSSA